MHFPVEGMKPVLATVTGYHGSQRFNLIKLISHAGASFVGNMLPSVTHLVCWKYEGKKYEIAKKLKMVIVNHRWVEECVKEGWRVPEKSFTYQCGEEVGPLLLVIPVEMELAMINQSEALKKKKPKLPMDIDNDIDYEDTTDSILFNEIDDFRFFHSQFAAPTKMFYGEEKHKAREAASEDLSEVSPSPSPASRYEVWKIERINVNGKYTSEVSNVAEKTAQSISKDEHGVVRIRWA